MITEILYHQVKDRQIHHKSFLNHYPPAKNFHFISWGRENNFKGSKFPSQWWCLNEWCFEMKHYGTVLTQAWITITRGTVWHRPNFTLTSSKYSDDNVNDRVRQTCFLQHLTWLRSKLKGEMSLIKRFDISLDSRRVDASIIYLFLLACDFLCLADVAYIPVPSPGVHQGVSVLSLVGNLRGGFLFQSVYNWLDASLHTGRHAPCYGVDRGRGWWGSLTQTLLIS